MSEEPQKSKKVRDIRERLGRAAAQSQAVEVPAEGVAPPPPSLGGIAPPPGFVGGQAAKQAGPFGGTVPGTASVNKATRQEVRIVVDEEAVDAAHHGLGRRARKLMLMTGAAAAIVGLMLGILATAVTQNRRAYNHAVRDAKALYQGVLMSADQVGEAKRLLDRASAAAKPRPGKGPSVDYEAIERLRALSTPFTASDFAGLQYTKFSQETVNSLFQYTRQVDELWDGFDKLAIHTLPEARRAELDAAAQDETALTTSPTGCVPTLGEGGFRCGLVYVDMPATIDPTTTKLKVRVNRSSRPFEKEIYVGQDLRQNASNYVILNNPEQSEGVLGQRKNAFASYRKELAALGKLMDQTMVNQGIAEKGLGTVAGYDEILSF